MEDKKTNTKLIDEKVTEQQKAAVAGRGFEEQGAEEAPPEIVVEN